MGNVSGEGTTEETRTSSLNETSYTVIVYISFVSDFFFTNVTGSLHVLEVLLIFGDELF